MCKKLAILATLTRFGRVCNDMAKSKVAKPHTHVATFDFARTGEPARGVEPEAGSLTHPQTSLPL
jgi:hypothetical protein